MYGYKNYNEGNTKGMDRETAMALYGEMIACPYTAGMTMRVIELGGQYAIVSYDKSMPDIAEVDLWCSRREWQHYVAQLNELAPTM